MTKDLPQQGINDSKEKDLSKLIKDALNDFPNRLDKLISWDKYATEKKGINIVDLKEPVTNENLLIAHAFRKLMLPDKDQMLELFRYIFEKKQCDPNHLIKVGDGLDKVAKAYFNERGNSYVNTFLHTLIVNEHRFASGNSLVEYVLDLPHIKKNFDFNKKDKIIEGPEGKEKDGKTILCLAAKMKEAVIVKKLCALKKKVAI